MERSFETKLHSGKSVNVSDMTVSDEDGYLSRSKTFNSNNKIVKERIWIAVKLTIQNLAAKVDAEPNARSRKYSRSSRLHVRMSKKSEHEQEASNESSMNDKMVCWCGTQDKEKSHETLGGLIPADCVGHEIWTCPR